MEVSVPIYKAVLIGCGGIGAGYDAPGDSWILTHLHALTASSRFRCAGVFDASPGRARAAAEKWCCPVLSALGELPSLGADLVIIATPDEQHVPSLLRVLSVARPRAALCEKPLAPELGAAEAALERCRHAGTMLAVNYQRRYDDSVRTLRDEIAGRAFGPLLTGSVVYSKGLLHNGSHAVDLLRFLLGEPRAFVKLAERVDWRAADPTVSGHLQFRGAGVSLAGADERAFSIFEVDLLFERGRVRFAHSGWTLERQAVEDDPVFPGFRELGPVVRTDTRLGAALAEQLEAIARFLDGGKAPDTVAEDVIGTQRVCERLRAAPIGCLQQLM